MADPTFEHRYMFSVKAPLRSYKLGDSPQGCRIDVAYENGTVTTDPTLFFESWRAELDRAGSAKVGSDSAKRQEWLKERRAEVKAAGGPPWLGLEGELISGSDWLLVRSDGAAEFSARATIREEEWANKGATRGGGLINIDLTSVVDVANAVWSEPGNGPPPSIDPLEKVADTSKGNFDLFFSAAVRLTTAQSSRAWAEERYRSEGFWRFQRLPVHQYVANTKVNMNGGLPAAIEFDVWRQRFLVSP